jgi:hypothetical protein
MHLLLYAPGVLTELIKDENDLNDEQGGVPGTTGSPAARTHSACPIAEPKVFIASRAS